MNLGRVEYDPGKFEHVGEDAFIRQNINFWQEKIFLSDHGEIPKVSILYRIFKTSYHLPFNRIGDPYELQYENLSQMSGNRAEL